jgi:hypothetical protein
MDTRSTPNNKIRKAHIRIVVYVLMLMMLQAKTKTCTMEEIWELDFHGFKISLFCCNLVDATRGVVQDKYKFINIDLNHQWYKSGPIVLAKYVAQVFYVLDTTNKRLKVVIPEKRWIIGVENVVDEEEFDQFDEIQPFVTSMIKQRISPANEAPYLHNDNHEKVKNFKKPRPQQKVAKWLCKICSMCENMAICVKIWLSLNICVKYAQCVKIWPFVRKFDFHWIFVWNMLNVWKYDNLCATLTFIGYLCEICSMCENMVVSDGHYTNSGNCSVSDLKKKGDAL